MVVYKLLNSRCGLSRCLTCGVLLKKKKKSQDQGDVQSKDFIVETQTAAHHIHKVKCFL